VGGGGTPSHTGDTGRLVARGPAVQTGQDAAAGLAGRKCLTGRDISLDRLEPVFVGESLVCVASERVTVARRG
jgi:hypothetical protein